MGGGGTCVPALAAVRSVSVTGTRYASNTKAELPMTIAEAAEERDDLALLVGSRIRRMAV
jgi:hypothetical protein